MQITFNTTNVDFELSKFGSAMLVTYAIVGIGTLAVASVHYGEKAIVAYKRRMTRKINAK